MLATLTHVRSGPIVASVANDYLKIMETIGERIDVPRIASIHVAVFEQDPRGNSKFGAMVLRDGTTGITYTGLDDALLDLQEPSRTGDLLGASPIEVARLYSGELGWQRSLGMAAINAVSQFVLSRGDYELPAMGRTLTQLAVGKGDHIGMVGYFAPLVKQARADGVRVTVLELDEYWLGDDEGVTVTLDPEHLSECNKIVCTGTVMVNGTVDSVLKHCRRATQILMVGPTVGCLPEPLFERGVTMLGGSRVVNTERFLTLWAAKEKWRDASERYVLSADYPGLEALLPAD